MRFGEKPGAVGEDAGNRCGKAGAPRVPFDALQAANQLRILLVYEVSRPSQRAEKTPGSPFR